MNHYMYSLEAFGRMMGDPPRMRAYEAALGRTVRPGDAVLDLGCGPGILAMLACRAGARRVYAIDASPVVDFARQLAAANGFADKITFFQDDSRQVELPERVNVIVSDLRGVLPFFAQGIPTVNDARERFLAPGGHMIPLRDVVVASVVAAPQHYNELTQPWQRTDLDFSAVLPLTLNSIYRSRRGTQTFLSSPQPWCTLDYSLGANQRAECDIRLPILREGTGHGVALWFEATLFDGVGYSTEPDYFENISNRQFLPWLSPVPLHPGEEVRLRLHADLIGHGYVWRWDTDVPSRGDRPAIAFRQSSFQGGSVFSAGLRKHASSFVPQLSPDGLAERWLLAAMDGRRTLLQIAAEAARLFPQVFRRDEDAFERAAEIADRFSR